MTTEQDLQSLLLRLSVLVASSLTTLSDPFPPTIIDPSSSSTYSAAKLSAQILNDVFQLLDAVQKCCTNLTLALKSNSSVKHVSPPSNFDPTHGLDVASLDAAKAQIHDLTKEYIPKITFLARKTSSEALVYRYVRKTEEDLRKETEERELVKSKGGHYVQQPYWREGEKLEKIKGMGLGKAWSKAVISEIIEVLGALGDLSETFMSERTLLVLRRASEARAKANNEHQGSVISVREHARTRDEARQRALQATSRVWNVCDTALKGSLPDDNRIAVRSNWKIRTGLLEDALIELADYIEKKKNGKDSDDEDEDEDKDLGLDDELEEKEDGIDVLCVPRPLPRTCAPEDIRDKEAIQPLLKAGCQLHSKAGELVLSRKASQMHETIDLDELDEVGEALSCALDDVIAAMLYGDRSNEGALADGQAEALEAFQQAAQRLYHLSAAMLDSDDNLEPLLQEFVKQSARFLRKQ